MPPPRPTVALIVLTGLPTGATEAVARLLLGLPGTVVVHHDLRAVPTGVVHRRVRDGAGDVTTAVRLTHGCISCTLREDLLPQLRHLAHDERTARIVLHLDPALEPERVCRALADMPVAGRTVIDDVDLRGVVAVVDVGSWLADATGAETVAGRGLSTLLGDERTVAQIAVEQMESADLIVVTGDAPARERAVADAVLDRLAPAAVRPGVDRLAADPRPLLLDDLAPGARRGRPVGVHGPLLRGAPPLDAASGVRLHPFTARRPFHPERLHDALDVLLDGVVRSRGRIWLATRPDEVMWLDSAGGGLRLGPAGHWLDGAGPEEWAADRERAALAAAGWDRRFGDRAHDVTVLCHDADPADVDAALRAALLTDDELAGGAPRWARLPDPFGRSHTDPCTPSPVVGEGPQGRGRRPYDG